MKENNAILDKTFAFALRIIKLYSYLTERKLDRVLSIQIRSGTSIGANVEEAIGGSSKKDFLKKLRFAYREARENKYWLKLFQESELIEKKLSESLIEDCVEISKILTAIISSKSKNINS